MLRLLNLLASFALGNLDIISMSPLYLAVTCSVSGCCLRSTGNFVTSGKCFRIQRNAWFDSGYMFMRQSMEVFGRISHIFYVKVDSDPEVNSRPAL